MKYRLRYQQQDLELPEGRFIIGRGENCQLSLDDPRVSRTHAALLVRAGEVWLEDLGSRNGVKVNGEKLADSRRLQPGDTVEVGSQRLTLLENAPESSEMGVRSPPTRRSYSLGVMAVLADKAIALGRGDEAERLLGGQLEQLLSELRGGLDLASDQCESIAAYAAKLAALTGRAKWVDYIVEVYALRGLVLPASVVDELYVTLRKVGQVDLTALREYLALLRGRISELGPSERFVVSRIEGLERLAAMR